MCRLAGRQVEMTLRPQPDELAGADDLQFQGHKIRWEQEVTEETENNFSSPVSLFVPV